MALTPLISSQPSVVESADPYLGITNFLDMSFDNSRDTAAVGPLQIAVVPEVYYTLPAGTSATVATDSRFTIDLGAANRPDSATWTVTSSTGVITFSSDTAVRELPDTPGVFELPANANVTIAKAEFCIPGEPRIIRFDGMLVTCKNGLTCTFPNAAEQSLGLAA